jgi:hypothetical protein
MTFAELTAHLGEPRLVRLLAITVIRGSPDLERDAR